MKRIFSAPETKMARVRTDVLISPALDLMFCQRLDITASTALIASAAELVIPPV
jgi:hypothetical protein